MKEARRAVEATVPASASACLPAGAVQHFHITPTTTVNGLKDEIGLVVGGSGDAVALVRGRGRADECRDAIRRTLQDTLDATVLPSTHRRFVSFDHSYRV